MSLLLSAVAGANPELVLALLKMGASLDEKIDVMSYSVPTLMHTTVCSALARELAIGLYAHWGLEPSVDRITRLCMILEYFLQRGMQREYFFS